MGTFRTLVAATAAAVAVALLVVTVTASSPACPGIAHPPPPTGTAAPGAPNIVFILSDDQRFDQMASMPNVRTLLASHGITFRHAYVTTPVCCPSRSSILTGLYSRHTGVYDNFFGPHGGAPAFNDSSTLATWLHSSGYHTALVGKYLNDYQALPACYIPPGWDRWDAIYGEPADHYYTPTLSENGRLVSYGAGPADYQATVLTSLATQWIRSTPGPFFLYFAPSNPHRPAIPAPQDVGRYANITPFRPPSYNEADVSDKPWNGSVPPMSKADIGTADRMNEHMNEALYSLDRDVGLIYDAVKARGELDNTVFVYMSDNGWLMGEHRLIAKTWPYEESVRVPMIWRLPWVNHAETSAYPALNIDLAPTWAAMAGAKTAPVDGQNLMPIVGPSPAPVQPTQRTWVEEWLGRDLSQMQGPADYESVHTSRWVYVRYANGWNELYDLKTDPYQLTNLYGDPAYAKIQASLEVDLQRQLASQPRSPAATP